MDAFGVTNTVHVPLPQHVDLAATHVVYSRYGEVESVERLAGEPNRACIVFYDVRSAAHAAWALGGQYCVPAPQTGSRTVRLDGSAKLETDDLQGISSILGDDSADGPTIYTLEFYDTRDASRYQERLASQGVLTDTLDSLPPGLPLPPSVAELHLAGHGGGEGGGLAANKSAEEAFDPPPGLPMPTAVVASTTATTPSEGDDGVGDDRDGAASPAPPGLALPPGLEATAAAVAGADEEAAKDASETAAEAAAEAVLAGVAAGAEEGEQVEEVAVESDSKGTSTPAEGAADWPAKVTIRGLPNKLLSEIMLEAILQQAGLDQEITNINAKPGKPCGEATVSFSSRAAAELCVIHFEGCQWDQSGAEVLVFLDSEGAADGATTTATGGTSSAAASSVVGGGLGGCISEEALMADMFAEDMDMDMLMYSAQMMGGFMDFSDQKMGAMPAGFEAGTAEAPVPSMLSAAAAAFVPKGTAATAVAANLRVVGSNSSTEVGESSEPEDEKDSPILRALAAPGCRAH